MGTLPQLRARTRDGALIRQARCPKCGLWADLDDDQYRGRVSIDCECGQYHETYDFQASD